MKTINAFPFSLANLLYWVTKRRNGTMIKYVIQDREAITIRQTALQRIHSAYQGATEDIIPWKGRSFRNLCHHNGDIAVFEQDKVQLFIADSAGAVKDPTSYNFIIDCGGVFESSTRLNRSILGWDSELKRELSHFSTRPCAPRILTIDWKDREAPDLAPGFWPALAGMVTGKVMANCQGGHGRSGTAIVCLLMALNPAYSAKDAIVHLRARHCPRAIESSQQHAYIDQVAEFLGREANTKEAIKVGNFKAEFHRMIGEGLG